MSCATDQFPAVRSRLLAALETGELRSEAGLSAVIDLIREATDCQAAAIRLTDEDGYAPYEAQCGFPKQFCARRNLLRLARDRCLCVQVLTEAIDPALPASTPSGSLIFGTAADMLAALRHLPNPPAHMSCPEVGFETVALVPIRGAGFPLGLIHCADPRPHHLSPVAVERLETVADDIGRALFFDSIWPSPWASPNLTGTPALCPMCGRRRTRGGEWLAPERLGLPPVPWSARPARRVLCPHCLSRQTPV